MTGAGIVAGLVYWMIAGRNAGGWREPPRPLTTPAAAAVAFAAAAAASVMKKRPEDAFSSPVASAKPRAMNRSGLYIALALALVVGLLFGIYPELDLQLAALFYDRRQQNLSAEIQHAGR